MNTLRTSNPLRRARLARNWTQSYLAKRADISQALVSRIENEQVSAGKKSAAKLVRVLPELPVAWLLGIEL